MHALTRRAAVAQRRVAATLLAAAGRPASLAAAAACKVSAPSSAAARHLHAVAPRASEVDAASIRPALTSFSSDENELRDMVAAFAKEELQPLVAKMDEEGKLDPILLQKIFNQGLMGVEIPAEYEGGGGMTFTQSCIVIEELAKIDPAVAVMVDIHNTLINTLTMKFGTEAQKAYWLPKLATDTVGSFCLSESSSGSDAFAMKTTAIKQPNGTYLVNGSKMWISNSKEAGLFMLFANVDPSKGYKGITCFLVPAGTPGMTIGKAENKLGIRASSTCELTFEDMVLTEDMVLGKVGEGYKIAIGGLNEGRIGIGAQMLGLAQGAFDAAVPYLHTRKQFGSTLASFQMIQASMAECATEIECARLLVYNAARLKEEGKPFLQNAAMAKLKASRVAEKVASQAIEWMGGLGFTKEVPLEKFYRDAKIGSIYEGTSNLQLQTIAKTISKQFQ